MRQHALTALTIALTLGPILDLNAQQQTPGTAGTPATSGKLERENLKRAAAALTSC